MLTKIVYAFQFVVYYLFQLVQSNISIAYLTLSPRLNFKAAFIEVPLTIQSDFGLLLFSNMVSMTPGSLVSDISADKKTATVHIIYTSSIDEMFAEVQKMQDKIKRFTT